MEKRTAKNEIFKISIYCKYIMFAVAMLSIFTNGFIVQAKGHFYNVMSFQNRSLTQEGLEGSAPEYTSEGDAGLYVREHIIARNQRFDFWIRISNSDEYTYSNQSELESISKEFGSKLWAKIYAKALEHTGKPYEGDYLRNAVYSMGYKQSMEFEPVPGKKNSVKISRVLYMVGNPTENSKEPVKYFTTASQEKEFENKAAEVVNSLNLSGDTEYEKVVKIYDYITNHVTYDYANLNNEGYLLKQSAYAALINKTSVCQGYATLFNYMANSAGLDSRIILGKSKKDEKSAEELHAWNAVRIGDRYYYVDATWDSANPEEDVYFLNGKGDFANHLDIHMDTPEGEKLPQEVIPLADYSYYKTVNKNYLSETKTVVTVGDVTTKNGYPAVNVDVVYNGKKLLRCVDYKVEYGIYNIDTYVWRITIRGIGLYQGDLPIDYLVPANMRQYIYQKEDKQNNTDNAQKNNTQNVSQKTLKVGAKFKVGKYTYKVTKAGGKKTVTLVAAGKNLKSVSIPASVRKNGDIYLVNAIGPNVFKNNSKLTSVVIGKNVKSIGANCFSGCKKLKKITFKGSSVNKVGKNSFKKTGSSVVVITPKSSKVKYAKLLKRGGISAKAKYK